MSSGHDDTSKEDLPDGASETAPVDSSAPNLELTGQADLDEKLVKPVFDGSTGIETAQVWIGAFLIAVAGLIAYSNSFALPMHYPDRQVLLDAPGGLSVVTAPAAAKASGVALLPMVTLALNMWLGVGALFHAVNVALHVINGVLVYFLARRLLGLNKPRDPAHTGPELSEPVAMLGGLLMALHPLATESVNLAIGRAPLLGATFSIGAVLLVLRAADRAEGRHIGALLGAGVCLAVGYACDVAALFVPAFALAADWVANGGGIARRAPAHAALWAMTIALGVWGLTAARTDQDPYAVFEPEVMVAPPVKAAAYSTGLTLAVNPIALSIEHDLPPSGFFDAQAPGANPVLTSTTAIGFGLIALILIGARSAGGLGLLWLLAALAPAAFFVPPYTHFTERALYFAIAGVALVFPWAVSKVVTKKPTAVVGGLASVALLLAAAAGTYLRNGVWLEEQALWNDASLKAPDAPEPLVRLGSMHFEAAQRAYAQAGQLARDNERPASLKMREQAQTEFGNAMNFLQQAVEMKPEDAALRRTLGSIFHYLGRRDDAIAMLTEALRLDPSSQECAAELASLYAADPAGRVRALDYYQRAARLGPLDPGLAASYADAQARAGNIVGALQTIAPFARAGGDQPSPAKAMVQQLTPAAERLRDAERRARDAEGADPASPQAARLRVNAMLANSQLLGAFYRLSRVLDLHPDDAEAWLRMGAIRAHAGDAEGFIREYAATAPMILDGGPPIWMQLVRMCADQDRWTAARTYIEYAATTSGEYAKPLVRLGELAIELEQSAVAVAVLEDAAKGDAADPTPWLLLTDIAIASNNLPQARRYLDEAERLGAPADATGPRREKAGATTEAEKQKPRVRVQ